MTVDTGFKELKLLVQVVNIRSYPRGRRLFKWWT